MLNFCDFIQVYVFTTNHHLKIRVLFVTSYFDNYTLKTELANVNV